MNPVYVKNISCISPQNSLREPFLATDVVSPDNTLLKAVEPSDYERYIPLMQGRRMSRILKMAIYTGKDCLEKAGLSHPDGIITATGKGNLTDTERFLKNALEFRETALNPTPFILSTYNAVSGALALGTGTTAYNQTFVHGGSSLESALLDAQMRLQDSKKHRRILVGCFDEVTADYYYIKEKLNYWKKEFKPGEDLWNQQDSNGTLAGEGASFFILDNRPEHALFSISKIHTCFGLRPGGVRRELERFRMDSGADKHSTIDLLILGLDGDAAFPYYKELLAALPEDIPVITFKHLCGEFETSGGFALWLLQTLLQQPNPENSPLWFRKPKPGNQLKTKNILLYNHFRGINHNFLMLSA